MAKNSIIVKRTGAEVIEEYTATAVAIKPGFLLELTSAGLVQAHSSAEGNVLPMFAIEDQFQGKSIADSYAVSVKIQCWIPRRGDQVYAYLADGQTVVIGDFLESNGAGALQKHVSETESWDVASPAGSITVPPNPIVGVALEAVDLSASANESNLGRIIIRIL
jgi:hypothetical protein